MSHAFTGLPTLNLVMEQVEGILEKAGYLGLITIGVEKGGRIEKAYGWQLYDFIIVTIARTLKNMAGRQLRKNDIIALAQEHDDTFLIFLSEKKSAGALTGERLESIVGRIRPLLQEQINTTLRDHLRGRLKIRIGSTLIHQNSKVRLERMLYRSIEGSCGKDRWRDGGEGSDRSGRLLQIIRSQTVEPHFQPITDMGSGQVFGFEAFIRGPSETAYESPATLFRIAEQSGLVSELDRLCIEKAWSRARLLDKHQKIFLNVHPATVADPTFPSLLETQWGGADIANVVFEVTERMLVSDYESFRQHLEPFRERGVQIAVDDTCAGYSSLQLLNELKPDFMKIDLSLVRGMDRDPMRRRLVETLVQFARAAGVGLIAEGVETKEEYDTLKALDVTLGQGFYFGKPAKTFSTSVMPGHHV